MGEIEKAEDYFRKKIEERMGAEDLEKEVQGGPSEHIKKVLKEEEFLSIEEIMAEVLFMLNEEISMGIYALITELDRRGVKLEDGKDLAHAVRALEERGLVEERLGERGRYLVITEKGMELVKEEIEKAEATRRAMGISEKER